MIASEIKLLQQRITHHADQLAFERLFKYYFNALRQFAASIVKEREVAEEIVEDVFVSVWQNRQEVALILNLKVYLYVAVRNRCLNFVIRNREIKVLSLDDLDVSCGNLTANPEDIMIGSEMLQEVNKAINDLPPKCRIIYKLVKEDGLKYREVAEILEISPRTVENQIATAIRKLATVLKINFATPVHQQQKKVF